MSFLDWIDSRTGLRKLLRTALFEHVPGGARWRYIWGSTLTFAIVVQFITGAILWMYYSPSAQTAWESVYYINEVLPAGWILRGIHHFMAQLMVPLLILHFMQVLIDGAYKAPREFNYWFGLGLLGITLAISLTGYLLPWDQRGFWATKVATNLVGGVPLLGDGLQRVVVGDSEYGHHTITRFFALHAGILPGMLVGLIVLHIALFRKHGLTPAMPKKKPDAMFWPDQVLKDSVACVIVMAAVLALVWHFKGAELGAPANPAEPYAAARPDWYFMALFQMLKLEIFQQQGPFGDWGLVWGSLIIPGLVFGLLAIMPFIGRWNIGHRFNLFVLFAGLAAFTVLTVQAYRHDAAEPHFRVAVAQAGRDAARVKELARAHGGIPVEGALFLLQNDTQTQGPRLFAAHCAKCHAYEGHDGLGNPIADKDRSAPDLAGFGSRKWISGLLDPSQIETLKYFGGTKFVHPPAGEKKSKMVRLVTEDFPDHSAEEKAQLGKIVIALSAEAKLPAQREADARDAAIIKEGRKLLADVALDCTDCHAYGSNEGGTGPTFEGYASEKWLTDFIKNPAHEDFYGKRNDRMPAFGEGARLSPRQIEMLVHWIRGE